MSSAEQPRFDAVAAAEQIHQQQSLDLHLPGEVLQLPTQVAIEGGRRPIVPAPELLPEELTDRANAKLFARLYRDRLRDLLSWAVRLDMIDAPDARTAAASVRAAARLADAAEAAGYRVDRLREELAAVGSKGAEAKAGTAKKVAPAKRPVKKGSPPSRPRKLRLPQKDPPKE